MSIGAGNVCGKICQVEAVKGAGRTKSTPSQK